MIIPILILVVITLLVGYSIGYSSRGADLERRTLAFNLRLVDSDYELIDAALHLQGAPVYIKVTKPDPRKKKKSASRSS